jgi:anti-sigma-K factor RsiG
VAPPRAVAAIAVAPPRAVAAIAVAAPRAPVPSAPVADALDRLAPPAAAGPLAGADMASLRARRNALQEAELALSYVRRQVQVRLDIVLDEREHRASGAAARDASALVADLPKILAEHSGGAGRGSFSDVAVPPAAVEAVVGDLNTIIGARDLGAIASLPDERLTAVAQELGEFERRVSQRRRALHATIDALQEEMLRRYKSGEASVDALLQ